MQRVAQPGEEMGGVAGDPAPNDDELWPQHVLEVGVVALETLGPGLPTEVLAFLHGGGCLGFRVVAVDLQVPKFGVGDEDAVVDDGRADAGAEGRHDDESPLPLGRTVVHLRHTGRVGVVDEDDVVAQLVFEHRLSVEVDPALVDVGRSTNNSVRDDAGDRNPDR